MTTRTFRPWVEPVAAQLRESRRQIVEVARSIPAEAWGKASPDENWTYKDLLAHLATGDWLCQTVLRAVVENQRLDMTALADLDGNNARLVEERRSRSVGELIAEVEAEGGETQGLLARLTEADDERRQRDAGATLGDYLRGFPGHDRQHLADLRTALEVR